MGPDSSCRLSSPSNPPCRMNLPAYTFTIFFLPLQETIPHLIILLALFQVQLHRSCKRHVKFHIARNTGSLATSVWAMCWLQQAAWDSASQILRALKSLCSSRKWLRDRSKYHQSRVAHTYTEIDIANKLRPQHSFTMPLRRKHAAKHNGD